MAGIYSSQGELFEYNNFVDAADEAAFDDFISEVDRRSYFATDIPVEYGDHLLVLSTCDYEFKDSRFVVVARKLRTGETESDLTAKYTSCPDRFMPDAWYQARGKRNPNKS